jgi:hypothetical protein
VLIVREDGATPPADQGIITDTAEFRSWVKSHGGEFRYWPSDISMDEHTPPEWKVLMGISRQSHPWMVVANHGKVTFNGPEPANSSATIALLEKLP